MTVESSVENQFCKTCNADVRPGSMFCYGCGSPVTAEALAKNGKEQNENRQANIPATSTPIIKPDAKIDKPIGKPLAEPALPGDKAPLADKAEAKNRHLVVEKETVLKTAAAVRKQAKPLPKKNVEVVWEQPKSSANVLFIIVALILVVFAVGVLMAMLYLR